MDITKTLNKQYAESAASVDYLYSCICRRTVLCPFRSSAFICSVHRDKHDRQSFRLYNLATMARGIRRYRRQQIRSVFLAFQVEIAKRSSYSTAFDRKLGRKILAARIVVTTITKSRCHGSVSGDECFCMVQCGHQNEK